MAYDGVVARIETMASRSIESILVTRSRSLRSSASQAWKVSRGRPLT